MARKTILDAINWQKESEKEIASHASEWRK